MNLKHPKQHKILIVLATMATLGPTAVTTGCQIRDPLEATVIPLGVDPAKVKTGIFDANIVVNTLEDGSGDTVKLNVLYKNGGRVLPAGWENAGSSTGAEEPEAFSLSPIADASAHTGSVAFDIIESGFAHDTKLILASWYDADDDGELDLSKNGESEMVRSPYFYDADEKTKAYLWAATFVQEGSDSYYYATALGAANGTNYVLNDDAVQNNAWMVLIDKSTEAPLGDETEGGDDTQSDEISNAESNEGTGENQPVED